MTFVFGPCVKQANKEAFYSSVKSFCLIEYRELSQGRQPRAKMKRVLKPKSE